MVNVPTGLNDFKTKVDKIDFGKLETVPKDLKKLNDAVDKEVVKKTKVESKSFREKKPWCNYFNSNKSVQHSQTKFKLGMLRSKFLILLV